MELGTLVIVTVDHPDGSTTQTLGNVGIITKIEHHATFDDDYTVHALHSDYIYGKDQIRELTDKECRNVLYDILIN